MGKPFVHPEELLAEGDATGQVQVICIWPKGVLDPFPMSGKRTETRLWTVAREKVIERLKQYGAVPVSEPDWFNPPFNAVTPYGDDGMAIAVILDTQKKQFAEPK